MPKNYHLFLKGYVGGWDFNADMVDYILDKYKNDEVHVLIDSTGGSVASALSISSLFRIHGNVHCHYVGMNASAATIASMGATRVTIDKDALFLVHKCSNLVFEWDYMNADQLEEHIHELQKMQDDQKTIDGCIAGMYASKCKRPQSELLELMKNGAWLTATQALEWGFVDEITDQDEDAKPQVTTEVVNSLAEAGIPLPPNVGAKKDTMLDRFMQFFATAFSKKNAAASGEESAATILSAMNKTFKLIATVLGDAMTLSDDKQTIILDENSASKIEAALESKDSDIAARDNSIAELNATIVKLNAEIADLKKEPAEATSSVVESSKAEDPYAPVEGTAAIEASKAFLKSF